MAKHLNLSLGFTADVSGAKKSLQELERTLTGLMDKATLDTGGLGLTDEIKGAIVAAGDLKVKLQQATTSTGNLDLSKFNKSLQEGGKKLSDYAKELTALGPEGQKAFQQLANSINNAEIPLKRSNKLLNEFATTLKNTARWQLSSSILHGLVGEVQSAYYYAQDLNESLNNIRIVTGQSVEQMSRFAKEANNAAKALSTSTTEYANAALIYYQQGDSEEAVRAKTDITVKLANVTRQSAEAVSDQLTAIWNNFANGTDDLEHFADVLVRLGADTASSSDEIAQGLEKFAAIGNTIGLSYENAAAALATVTAQTRQSADVVGTAFKTIFARIQGLNLGETLEDGTTLNKYSEALLKVGINIKDQSGQLKDMDQILEEMGARWTSLSDDQQVALAQTVAGVRQYNQLMALMDNWDFYEKNLQAAKDAEGSLQRQADIYSEGWEAASKRVSAAAEDIYDSILNDEAFVDMLNFFADFLEAIGDIIDGLGGMKGVLMIVASVLANTFSADIAAGIDNVIYSLKMSTKKGFQEILDTKKEATQALRDTIPEDDSGTVGLIITGKADMQDKLIEKTLELEKANNAITESEKELAQQLMDTTNKLGDRIQKAQELQTQEQEQMDAQVSNLGRGHGTKESRAELRSNTKEFLKTEQAYGYQNSLVQSMKGTLSKSKLKDNGLEDLKKQFKDIEKTAKTTGKQLPKPIERAMKLIAKASSLDQVEKCITGLERVTDNFGEELLDMQQQIIAAFGDNPPPNLLQSLEELRIKAEQVGNTDASIVIDTTDFNAAVENVEETIDGFEGHVAGISEIATNVSTSVMDLTFAFQSLSNTKDVWSDPDSSGWEKFASVVNAATMTLRAYESVTAVTKQITDALARAKAKETLETIKSDAITKGSILTQVAAAFSTGGLSAAFGVLTGAVKANAKAFMTHPLLGPILAIVSAVMAGIIGLVSAFNSGSESTEEATERHKQNTEAIQEENEANKKLIQSMDANLKAYEKAIESGEGVESAKEALDQATRELAEAYDIEGAALAQLTGKYEDYEKVLGKAVTKRKEDIKTETDAIKTQQTDVRQRIRENSTKGNGRLSGNDYMLDFEGFNGGFGQKDETNAVNKLKQHIDSKYISTSDGDSIQFKTEAGNFDEMLELYEQMSAAYSDMEANMSEADKRDSDVYRETGEWLQRMGADLEEYKKLRDELAALNLESQTIDAAMDVSSLEEYEKWAQQVEYIMKQQGKSQEEIDAAIDTLASTSLNTSLESYHQASKGLDELSKTTQVSSTALRKVYGEIMEGESRYSEAAFWAVDWANVTAMKRHWSQHRHISMLLLKWRPLTRMLLQLPICCKKSLKMVFPKVMLIS